MQKCTIYTTDRYQDRAFINYATVNGIEFKIYNIKEYLTEKVIEKIASNIDFLIIFSDMGNYFYQTLFSVCDKTIYIDDHKINIEKYRKYLTILYKKKIESDNRDKVLSTLSKGSNIIESAKIYQEDVVKKLQNVKRVKIKIFPMGLRHGR